jgi:hypothetical protein
MWEVDDRLVILPPTLVAEYLHRLLTNARELCVGIPQHRLATMIWFFQEICSSYWHEVRSKEVPKDVQASTVLALGNFYRDFLDEDLLIRNRWSQRA